MKIESVLNYIKQAKNTTFFDIKKALRYDNPRYLDAILRELIEDGKIYYKREAKTYHIKDQLELVGIFRDTRHDYGFVEVEGEDSSYFVPAKFKLNALNGDTVKIRLFPLKEEDIKKARKAAGKVVRVIKRNGNNIVGEIQEKDGTIIFKPDDSTWKYECEIVNKENLKNGQIVTTKFVDFQNNIVSLKVEEILDSSRRDLTDWLVIANKYNLQMKFTDEAMKETETLSIDDSNSRRDLSNELIVTIDGEKSKDLDDAISVSKLGNGNWKVGIHIADVSHYVREETQLDYEAYQRATSVYLIDKVVPMLPGILSNDLCSLNPNTKKLTMSIELEINQNGDVVKTDVFESIIISKHRLTYNEVDKLYQDNMSTNFDVELKTMLLEALNVSKVLREVKIKKGMIDFQISETQVELDENGTPIKIMEKFQTESEKVIEDLMVLANENIAKCFSTNELDSMFRVHGAPNFENIENFVQIAKGFGEFFSKKVEDITNFDLMNFVQNLKGKKYEFILKKFMIQSMEKAMYHEKDSGHYALGLENYLHFTSPIRRYPDLIVHRLLKKYILRQYKIGEDIANLNVQAKWCSEKEKEAMVAERKLVDIKKTKFLLKQPNVVYEGIISGINTYGFYVELSNSINGFVRVEEITFDTFEYDEVKRRFFNKFKQISFGLSDPVKVKVKSADVVKGTIDFELIYESNSNQ